MELCTSPLSPPRGSLAVKESFRTVRASACVGSVACRHCGVVLDLAHEENCGSRVVQCSACAAFMAASLLVAQHVGECPQRAVRCPRCEGYLAYVLFEAHQKKCLYKDVEKSSPAVVMEEPTEKTRREVAAVMEPTPVEETRTAEKVTVSVLYC